MTVKEFKEVQSELPNKPGVYRFIDENDNILYIGKAVSLKKRVSNYFQQTKTQSSRIRLMVKKANKIKFTIVNSETDALLLENSMIKEHQPRYNILLKDSKTYPYICIKKERFPRIMAIRNREDDGAEYLGPFVSMTMVKYLLDIFSNTFQLRTCNFNLTKENVEKKKYKVCLDYHIEKCGGPCEGIVSEEEYNEQINQIRKILKGKIHLVIKDLKTKMEGFAEDLKFEEAQQIAEQLKLLEKYQSKSTVANPKIKDLEVYTIEEKNDIHYVNFMVIVNGNILQTSTLEFKKHFDETNAEVLLHAILQIRDKFNLSTKEIILPFELNGALEELNWTVPLRGDKLDLIKLSRKNLLFYINNKMTRLEKSKIPAHERILSKLKSDLHLRAMPYQIECFDNSNIQGTNPVSSCVVFKNAKPSKKDYRHFKVKTVEGPDDFASMKEVVYRRYKRLLEENEALPQLILIDGGKGQLSAALESLRELDLIGQVAIVSIAKRLEEIYFPNDPLPLHIDKKSESLKLLQQLRDEAHRFAITFHRQLRSKGAITTELDDIKGVGDKTKQSLLSTFKSVKKIKEQSLEQLIEIVGKQKGTIVFEYFQAKE